MKNKCLVWGVAIAVLTAGPALATDLTYYPPSSSPAAPASSPPSAATPITGDISLEFGAFSETGASGTFGDIYGRFNVPIGNGWNFEAEGLAFDSFSYFTEFAAVGHLYKNLPRAAVGAFAGVGAFSSSFTDWMVGVEGQSYAFASGALGAEVHVAGGNNGVGWMQGSVFGAHFFDPDTAVLANAGGWAGWNGSPSGVFGGLALMKRFTGTPFSGYVRAIAKTNSASVSSVSAMVGVTLNADPPGTTLLNHLFSVPWFEAQAL